MYVFLFLCVDVGVGESGGQCRVSFFPLWLPTLFWSVLSLKLKLILWSSLGGQSLLSQAGAEVRHMLPYPVKCVGAGALNSGPCAHSMPLSAKLFLQPVFWALTATVPPWHLSSSLETRGLFLSCSFYFYVFTRWDLRVFFCSLPLSMLLGVGAVFRAATWMEWSWRRGSGVSNLLI